MFAVWKLAHLVFHQCSLFSGQGHLSKGFINKEFIHVLERAHITSHLIIYFLKSHLLKRVIYNPEPSS